MKREVKAFAPASVSNVACGFDIMGFALDQPGDVVTVRFADEPGVRIAGIRGMGAGLPLDPSKNTAGAPVVALAKTSAMKRGIEIDIEKGVRAGSGIGSSAASAVAAAVACNELLGLRLTKEELLPFAMEGEKIASGAEHADNLAPSLWGGFVLVRGYHPTDIVHIAVPDQLWCTVIHPEIEIRTREARKLLPQSVPLNDVIAQTGNAAGLVAGLLKKDYDLIGRSLQDVLAEPARKHTIQGYDAMKTAAVQSGALGCNIAGSGPSVFALSKGEEVARAVERALSEVLKSLKCPYKTYISRIALSGARIVS